VITTRDDGCILLRVKVVPGAKRDQIAGVLAMPDGDRLKVRVCAPPEGGRANQAVCALIARRVGLKPAQVTIASGASSAEKTVALSGFAHSKSGFDDNALRTLLLRQRA